MAATRPIAVEKDKPSDVAQLVANNNTFPAGKQLTGSNGPVASAIAGTRVAGGTPLKGGSV